MLAIVNQENTLKGVFERQSYLDHAYRTESPKSVLEQEMVDNFQR